MRLDRPDQEKAVVARDAADARHEAVQVLDQGLEERARLLRNVRKEGAHGHRARQALGLREFAGRPLALLAAAGHDPDLLVDLVRGAQDARRLALEEEHLLLLEDLEEPPVLGELGAQAIGDDLPEDVHRMPFAGAAAAGALARGVSCCSRTEASPRPPPLARLCDMASVSM